MPVLTLTEKLDQLDSRYEEMTQQLSSADVMADSTRFQKLAKQHAELSEIVAKHREYKQIEKDLTGAHQMFLDDRIGSIEVGKDADIAVWDRDMYTISTDQLKDLRCELTLLAGKVVYRTGS